MEDKASRIILWTKGEPQPPVRVELHPTNKCNLKCKFCWQSASKNKNSTLELNDEKLLAIVKEAGEWGVKEWIISGGGEPLVRKGITLNFMKLIKSYNMWGQLTTNGTLFDEKTAKEIVDMKWDQVQFSIDGPNAKTHDYLRGVNGAFEKAVKNAKFLSDYKKEKENDAPYLGFNTVLNRLNYNKLPEMIDLCKEVGFQLVYFEPIYPGYLEKERLTLNEDEKEEMQRYIRETIKKAKKLNISTNIENFYRKDIIGKEEFGNTILKETEKDANPYVSLPCYQPWYLMGIKGCGLAGCCSTFEIGEKIQNRTLKEVWNGPVFNKIRQEMLSKKLPSYCSKCSVVVVMENKEIRKRIKEKLKEKNKLKMILKKWMKR
jgi:MoaA/NifB/PqqE/SkfB family radical SAM enzyme